MNELQTLREEFRQIACFIRELKRDYSVLEEKIELSTADVLHLLGISKASLAVTLQRQRAVAPKKINNNIFFMI